MATNDNQTVEQFRHLGLTNFDQIGFVVEDLDAAIAMYDPLFGPLARTDYGPGQASFRGGPRTSYDLRFAFGKLGALEIELIQWVSGDTPHREFIESGRQGMHHLRFRVNELDEWTQQLRAIGYEKIWHEDISPEIGFAYYERAGDSLLLELLKYPEDGDPAKPLTEQG